MIKTILILVVVAVAALMLYATTRPDSFRVERKLLIQAPPEKLFPLIDDLQGFNRWNPYLAKDPQVKGSFEGPSAGPGAVYRWAGNKAVGAGSMEIKSHTPPRQITIEMVFLAPFAGVNTVEFKLQPQGTGTEVSWAISGPQLFIPKLMGIFINMDQLIGRDFEVGLANLRQIAEAPAAR